MPDIDHGPVTLADLAGRNFAEVWEAAQILECDPRTVRTACRSGEIPHTKVGSTYRVPVAWLLRSAAAGITEPAGSPESGVPAGSGVMALHQAGDAASQVIPTG